MQVSQYETLPRTHTVPVMTSVVINWESARLQSSSQQNIYHYFYNRLMEHWHNLKVVNKQLTCMKGGMKPRETIARDELHPFCVCTVQEARA